MKLSQYDTIMFIAHTHHVEKRPKKKLKKQFLISNPARKKIGKN
jgi:hypothetical protein